MANDTKALEVAIQQAEETVTLKNKQIAEIGEINEEKHGQINEQIKEIEKYESVYEQEKNAKQKVASLENIQTHWDILTKGLDKKGIIVGILEEKIDPFKSAIESRIQELMGTDWEVSTGKEGEWNLQVRYKQNERKIVQLSDGERTALCIGIQDALARLMKSDILILDRIEYLDDNILEKLYTIIQQGQGQYGNIIIATCDEREIPGAKNYTVKDGKIFEYAIKQ